MPLPGTLGAAGSLGEKGVYDGGETEGEGMNMDRKELKTFSTYKDMAYRSLRFLYNHPRCGDEKLMGWLDSWFTDFWAEAEAIRTNLGRDKPGKG